MTDHSAAAPPPPPTLARRADGWWVLYARTGDGRVVNVGPLRTKREATTLWLQLSGLFALGQPTR